MSEVGDVMQILGLIILILVAYRLDTRLSPKGITKLASDVYTSFRMRVTGEEGNYQKRKGKLYGLMQNFLFEDVGPDAISSFIPSMPPLVSKWIMSKVNDSELGDYLRENPGMIPDALEMVGQIMQQFGTASESLDRPEEKGVW